MRTKTGRKGQKILALLLAVLMVVNLVPMTSFGAWAATPSQPEGVTITVTDEEQYPVAGAMVEYTIKSAKEGAADRTGTAITDPEGTAVVLAEADYEADILSVTAVVSKDGYRTDSSILDRKITSAQEDIAVSIQSVVVPGITVTPLEGKYNGGEQALVSVSGMKTGDIVSYRLGDGGWSEELPMASEVDTYSVSVRVERSGYDPYESGELEASIAKGDFEVEIEALCGVYTGTPQNAVAILSGTEDGDQIVYTFDGYTSDEVPVFTNVGSYEVSVTVHRNDNYNDFTGVYTAEIKAAENTDHITASLHEDLVYTGEAQELVKEVKGTKPGDTVEYRLNDGLWTTDSPTGTDAGSYTVEIRVLRENYEDKAIELNPATAVIRKASQNIGFVRDNKEEVIFNDTDASKNVYDFSAEGGSLDVPVITYAVENGADNDTTPIAEIASIDAQGKVTVLKGGYIVKIIATVAGDQNYEDASAEFYLAVKDDQSGLISFENSSVAYMLGTSDLISGQTADKTYRGDNGEVSYRADVITDSTKTLADIGVSINMRTGRVSLTDMARLSAFLTQNGNFVSLRVTADKKAGTKGWGPWKKEVYAAGQAVYRIDISTEAIPESAYTMQDPEGTMLTGPNGTNGWYNTAVTVIPADGYTIAQPVNSGSFAFKDQVVFEDQGERERVVYLKNKSTGAVTAPITISVTKLDNVAPDGSKIEITYPKEKNFIENILYYNKDITITFTAYDATSGIDSFSWAYTREDGASTSNLESDSGTAVAVKDPEDQTRFTAEITLPKDQAAQMKGHLSVTVGDQAGNISDRKDDTGKVFVVDTITPTQTVSYSMKELGGTTQAVDNVHYFSDEVEFVFAITEANFFAGDVEISVSRDGSDPERQTVTWSDTPVLDQHEARLTLSGEGEFVVYMTYKDRSGWEMTSYQSEKIVVDLTDPVIEFAYSNGGASSKDEETEQKATVKITEHNFRARDIEVVTSAEDINGNTIPANNLQDYLRGCTWTSEGDVHTAVIDAQFVDAIYTLTIHYRDLSLRAAKEFVTDSFIVDRTAPAAEEMSVTYSTPITETILSVITLGFYNPNVTVTFTGVDPISGIDHFTWGYTRQSGASEINVEKYEDTVLAAVQDSTDKSKFTASIVLPEDEAHQLRGSFAFTAADKYSNVSEKITDDAHVIVVDTVSPAMTAEYTVPVRTVGSKMYYNDAVDVKFTVTEANFFAEDVKVRLSKDGGSDRLIAPSWTDLSTDVHVGTFTIPAAEDHGDDGDYIVKVSYRDRSSNEMEDYTSQTIVIDTVAPVSSVVYSDTTPENTMSDSEGHARAYFKDTQTAAFTITEHNFDSREVVFKITAEDVAGNALNVDALHTKAEWTSSGDVHTILITYPGDANYTFDVDYTDLAGNEMADYSPDYFTVDKTAPTDLNISYSTSLLDTVLSGITFGFYNAPVTATITATDNISRINAFEYSYLAAAGVSNVNASLSGQKIEEGGITYSAGGAAASASFQIPAGALSGSNQFNGTVDFNAADRSRNVSDYLRDTKRIVVDNISPNADVQYNAPVQNTGGTAYYAGDIQASVTVHEANFYPEDVNVSVTKDGASYSVTPSWSAGSTDVHVGTFTLTGDGDYFVTISGADKSQNAMQQYRSGQMTIDTEIVEPKILINGQEGDGQAFKGEVIPSIYFEDRNFAGCEVKLTRTSFADKNVDVTEKFIAGHTDTGDTTAAGTYDTFEEIPENDGIYTISVTASDKSGHTSEKAVTFTVNRFGSVYEYSDYLVSLIEDGGAYVQAVEDDLIITEYNADRLLSRSLDIEIQRDGKPLDETEYDVTPEINEKVSVGSSGWYQYQYTIDKANFAKDGVYKIAVSSKDATGNTPENTNYENKAILFRVDATAPEINSISGLEKEIINATKVDIRYTVFDAIGLSSIQIYLDGRESGKITEFDDQQEYQGELTLNESSAQQNVRFVITDRAGNVTDTDSEQFASVYAFNSSVIVSTNFFVRWYADKPLFYGSIAAVAAIAGGAVVLIVLLRKKKNKAGQN